MSLTTPEQEGGRVPPALMPLLRGLEDLKRIRSASQAGSIAERLFAEAWSALAAGAHPADVARHAVRRALAAMVLGDLDAGLLRMVGVPDAAANGIIQTTIATASEPLSAEMRDWLLDAPTLVATGDPPPFVARLAAQPRAGATSPGRGRLILDPPESHAEHCAIAAVFGVILAPVWGARPETVFLAGLAHHLHNALLPDSGFAGETALGEWLEPAMERATALALGELERGLRTAVQEACRILPDAGTPEGRAFHAADTLDRVLQVEAQLRAAGTSMAFVLREMELVHAGPVKPFQDAVLARMGLAA